MLWQAVGRMKALREVRRNLGGGDLGLSLDLVEDLLRCALDDTASDGQAGAGFQVQIDLAGSHATFVDTPEYFVSMRSS